MNRNAFTNNLVECSALGGDGVGFQTDEVVVGDIIVGNITQFNLIGSMWMHVMEWELRYNEAQLVYESP